MNKLTIDALTLAIAHLELHLEMMIDLEERRNTQEYTLKIEEYKEKTKALKDLKENFEK